MAKKPFYTDQRWITLISFFVLFAVVSVIMFVTGPKDQTEDVSLNSQTQLAVRFIDVGEGDCSVVKTPEGKAVMIDTGLREYRTQMLTSLESMGINSLEALILTHSHDDHIGSAASLFDALDISELVLPNVADYSAYKDVIEAAQAKGAKITRAASPKRMVLDGAVFDFLYDGSDSEDFGSNSSIVIRLTFGKVSFLFTGDMEEPQERALLEEMTDLRSQVLKIGHHGSETSSCEDFLEEVSPEYAVISVGRDNSYGHPDLAVLERLENECKKIFRTDKNSDVTAVTDGESVKILTKK